MGLQIDLHAKLKEYFGFDNFKGNQEQIIKNVLAGNNTFVLMPTGGGKSLCYQLPALILDGTAIVISPLIALMKNQVDAMRSFSASRDQPIKHGLRLQAAIRPYFALKVSKITVHAAYSPSASLSACSALSEVNPQNRHRRFASCLFSTMRA